MGNEMNSKGGMLLANGIVFGRGACVGQVVLSNKNCSKHSSLTRSLDENYFHYIPEDKWNGRRYSGNISDLF